jgi:hypothetical protein
MVKRLAICSVLLAVLSPGSLDTYHAVVLR